VDALDSELIRSSEVSGIRLPLPISKVDEIRSGEEMRMTGSIELVVAALAAGATAGLTDTASTAVKDAYTGLKTVTRKVLHRDRSVDTAEIDRHLANPQDHRRQLTEALTAVDAGEDAELAAAAKRVLVLVSSASADRFHIHDNQGVQIGDGNTMTNNFSS
jgi:hypothetical protein